MSNCTVTVTDNGYVRYVVTGGNEFSLAIAELHKSLTSCVSNIIEAFSFGEPVRRANSAFWHFARIIVDPFTDMRRVNRKRQRQAAAMLDCRDSIALAGAHYGDG